VPSITPASRVQFLKGVGEGRARVLQEAGLETVRDLLWFFPLRYEDRRHPTRLADLGRFLDAPVLMRGRIVSAHARVSPVKRLKLFEAILDDGTGSVKLI
jgi:ATP-dependent DNA helicase RecG